MGNNNSNYGNGHISSKSRHLHHDYHHQRGHGKWGASSSDLGESSGNRMKKGYLPTRGYTGNHSKLPSPHKVLPSVNPTSAAKLLKPTSNGAILHQGGTISGRKLLSELDPHSPEAEDLRRAMRKRSTASMPGNGDMLGPASGRSTPNLSVMDFNGGGMERNGPRRASSKGSSRDYDSEPDMRDTDDHHRHNRDDSSPQRSISPVPNSFTLIQESPAKKQIRTKKKGKAPPPPMSPGDNPQMFRVGGDMSCCSPHSPQLLSPCGESKKASRLFKTKAESRLAAASGPRSPEICCDLEMSRGGVMRASMDANANRFFRGERDRSSLHSAVEASLCTSKATSAAALSSRKHSEGSGGMLRKTSLGSAMLNMNKNGDGVGGGGMSSRNNPEVRNKKMAPLGRDQASASSAPLNKIVTTNDERVPKTHRVSSTSILPPIMPYGQSQSSSTNNSNNGGKPSVNQKVSNNNKGVISSSSSQSKTAALHQQNNNNNSSSSNNNNNNSKPILPNGKVSGNGGGSGNGAPTATTTNNNNVHHGKRKTTAAPAVPTTNAINNDKADSNNKTKQFYFGMDAQPASNNNSSNKQNHQKTVATVHQQSDSDNNNNECRLLPSAKMNNRMLINHLEKVSSTNSSELLQIKQDSGSFDTSEKASLTTTRNDAANKGQHLQRESSSELSSSDLDIPLNIRPTLPAKKLGLPRFSPTAAWRALDSPSRVSVSGRSYSSEEGYGHDRIQRYMRQIPPSRAHNHERSAGDSGISAGDAGSPANQELLGDQSTTTNTPSSSHPPVPPPVMTNGVGGGSGLRGYKLRDRSSTGKQNGLLRDGSSDIAKCWTPEQDLDESSSSEEFDDAQLSPPHHHHNSVPGSHPLQHSSSNVATRVLATGLGTPPKLTTRNNLFERGHQSSALGMVSDSDQQYHSDRPGNMYVRSRKVMNGGSGKSGANANGSVLNSSQQQSHDEIKKSQGGGGVGGASRYYRNLRSQPWRQPNQIRQPTSNNTNHSNGTREFVGLDTNWFLSRSEPNSLNLIGNGEYDNIEQQELRISLAEQDDDEEEDNNNFEDNEGDVDDDLYLPNDSGNNNNNKQRSSAAKAMKMAMNMHSNIHNGGGNGVDNVVNNEYDEIDGCGVVGGTTSTRLESEIGYGPSSMSFSSPLPSPSAVKINRNKVTGRGQMSNKDPPNKQHRHYRQQQLVSSTTLLAEEFERDQNAEMMLASPNGNSNVRYGDSWERKPFSHIMYLPQYDSRRASSSAGTRRTKSVDNLNFSEMTVYQPRKTSQYNNPMSPNISNTSGIGHTSSGMARQHQRRSRSPSDRGRRMVKRSDPEEPYERSQSVPPFTAEEENERRHRVLQDQESARQHREAMAAAEREQKKKKFKFQSTLRVLERKKIEEQLSRDAEEKERKRLYEQEQMRKVEEEFQRKRVREKVLEMEAAAAAAAAAAASNNNKNGGGNNNSKGGKAGHNHIAHNNMDKIEAANRYDVSFEPRPSSGERNSSYRNGGNSGRSSNISYTTTTMSNNHHQALFQRQEPEGAPDSAANGGVGDLRKELISASRNRSGFPGFNTGKHSELTQELSEFCTPTGQRQYFDYRRAHHDGEGYLRSGPMTRYYNSSSSSDIFPVTSRRDKRKGGGGSSVISSSKSSVGYLRPTVHPEIVCDIPVKPFPYVVNFSRLSSSNMDLLTESERPRSGLGGNTSVLSDNYRKDWAHHVSRGNGPARASSVISLHSAPPSSRLENFRHSSVDLTGGSVLHTPPHSPRQSKYSTSPSSASPVSNSRPLSSPDEKFYQNHFNDVNRPKFKTPNVPQEMWNGDCVTGNKTVVMLNTPHPEGSSPTPTPYQPAPAPYNRPKAFRPVDFNPTPTSSGGLSPAHAFHHASAKLTTPPVN